MVRGLMLVILITLGEWSEDGERADTCHTDNTGGEWIDDGEVDSLPCQQ